MRTLAREGIKFGHFILIAAIQVILAGTLTGVQGYIPGKVLAALSTVKWLELELA